MHFRRLTCFLLGAWLAGSLFLAFVITENSGAADRLLARPSLPAAEQIHSMGHSAARAFLQYAASEQNRQFRQAWELFQVGLGLLLFLTLLFASREGKLTMLPVLLMLLLVCVQRFYLTPEINAYGRLVDFATASQALGERNKLWILRFAYGSAEGLKVVIGLGLAVKLFFYSRRRSRQTRSQINLVDKAYNSHVNG